jgi:hypothetical protein
MNSNLSNETASFQTEVASRFGLLPNFFLSAPDAPELVPKLWDFAKAAYFDRAGAYVSKYSRCQD